MLILLASLLLCLYTKAQNGREQTYLQARLDASLELQNYLVGCALAVYASVKAKLFSASSAGVFLEGDFCGLTAQ